MCYYFTGLTHFSPVLAFGTSVYRIDGVCLNNKMEFLHEDQLYQQQYLGMTV